MPGKSLKGGAYEREMCRRLSEWWSDGDRDDLFWRSSQSGGRATQRAKKGKKTAGSYGDIAALDPLGQELLNIVTIEIKRGYTSAHIHSLLDRKPKHTVQEFESFVLQAEAAAERAETKWWWLITRRDQREAMIWYPSSMFRGSFLFSPPCVSVEVVFKDGQPRYIDGAQLEVFLGNLEPDDLLNRL